MKYRLQGLSLATLLVTLTLLWSAPVTAFGGNDKKVLLKDVQTLTLHRGKMTAGRRTSPVPQLSCVGGNACGHYEPDVVQCTNAGFDGSDVQWKCQADLPQDLRFGELDVYCEGYNNPDDPYVLKGSCGLEYKLHYINVRHKQDHPQRQTNFQPWSAKVKRKSWIETIYLWTWISIVGFILYSFVKNCFQPLDRGGRHDPPPPYRAPGGGSGGGGGGGGSGGDGPGGGWGSGWDNNNHYRNKPTGGTGYRPGFWTGVGVGGLATHLAANRDRQREYDPRPTYPSSSSWGSSSSQPSSAFASPSAGYGASSPSSSSSTSGPTRTATGFGGTRRR